MMGRKKDFQYLRRSAGTHGAIFPKMMIVSVRTKRSDGTFKTFIIIEATYDMSQRDIEKRSLNIQMMFVLQQGPCLP